MSLGGSVERTIVIRCDSAHIPLMLGTNHTHAIFRDSSPDGQFLDEL
jgi:hypothetical protein